MADKVSIVVVNWRRYEDTRRCLQSIVDSCDQSHEIVLVDNESQPEELAKLKSLYPAIRQIANQENRGFSPACNQGMELGLESGADFVFLLNNDALVDSRTIPALLAAFDQAGKEGSKIGIAGSVNYYLNEPDKICFGAGEINMLSGVSRQQPIDISKAVVDVDYVSGAAMILSRDLLLSVGVFDPRYFAYYEDSDICRRTKNKGFRVVLVRDSKILHEVSASSGGHESLLQHYYSVRSQLLYMKTHARIVQRLAFLLHFSYRLFGRKLFGCLFLPSKIRWLRFRFCLAALRDFQRGYFGPCPADLMTEIQFEGSL